MLPLQAMNQKDMDEWVLVIKNSIAQRLKRNHSQLTASSATGGVGKFWKHVRTRSQAHIRSMRINAHIHEEFHCAAPQAQLPEA